MNPDVAEEDIEPLQTNQYGYLDGPRFCLRSFPIWYRWRQVHEEEQERKKERVAKSGRVVEQRAQAEPLVSAAGLAVRKSKASSKFSEESGVSFGVEWFQTMGQMELSYALIEEEADLTEDDFVVELSSWELIVYRRHYVEGLERLDHLSGDLHADVHRKLCWWQIVEDMDGSGRRLHITLVKMAHKGWNCPWRLHPKNPHRDRFWPMANYEKLAYANLGEYRGGSCERPTPLPPGEPAEVKDELLASLEPETLCTGVDCDEEDEEHVYLTVHFDEENLDAVLAKVPLEELFGADVGEDTVELFINGIGYKLLSGELKGLCVPALSTWVFEKALRRKLSPKSGIKAPAFYNPALMIKIVKADNAQGIWGGTFVSVNSPVFRKPRERLSWVDMMQRALVLAPMAPLDTWAKTAAAKKLCVAVECSHDKDSVVITMHMDKRLDAFAALYRLDVTTFFSMRVSERVLEVSVLADCEYSMCYGWLGGSCLPAKTSWEAVRLSKAAAPKAKKAKSGGGTALTVEEARALQGEILEAFSLPNFRQRLLILEKSCAGPGEFSKERSRHNLTAQARILPSYGFDGNSEGVIDMVKVMNRPDILQDDQNTELTQRINSLMGEIRLRPAVPFLAEDPRFLGKWEFKQRIRGSLELSQIEQDKSKLHINMTVIGLVMKGELQHLPKPKACKDQGPWLQGELVCPSESVASGIRLRLDEGLQKIVFDFRRRNEMLWVEGVEATLEADVPDEKLAKDLEETHWAVQVKVAKAPGYGRWWAKPFVRTEPGDPMPEEEVEEDTQEELEDEEEDKAKPIALLFPGQGSQYVKMMDGVKDLKPVKNMLSKANDILGYDLLELCLSGSEDELGETRYCQPALYVASLAGMEQLRQTREEAVTEVSAVAGLSLGEYTALCAAGVLTFEDGLRLVQLRGEAMHEAATIGKQRMLSVVGLTRERLEELCAAARAEEGGAAVCQVANSLFPKGYAVGGTQEAIEALEKLATEGGAIQAKILKTAGAFHTPLMAPAAEKLAIALDDALPKMRPPKCTIWMNASAQAMPAGSDPHAIVQLLKKQLTSPVLWEDLVVGMIESGVQEFYEVGPRKQLKAMMKRISPEDWKTMQNVSV